MTLAYYAVPRSSQNCLLGRLKEAKPGKRREKLGPRPGSGSEQGGGSGAVLLALAGKPPASRVSTAHAAFPRRALSETREGKNSHPPNFTVPALEPPRTQLRSPLQEQQRRERREPIPAVLFSMQPSQKEFRPREPSGGQRPFRAASARPAPRRAPAPHSSGSALFIGHLPRQSKRCQRITLYKRQRERGKGAFHAGSLGASLTPPSGWRHWAGLICITAAPWSPCWGLESRSHPPRYLLDHRLVTPTRQACGIAGRVGAGGPGDRLALRVSRRQGVGWEDDYKTEKPSRGIRETLVALVESSAKRPLARVPACLS